MSGELVSMHLLVLSAFRLKSDDRQATAPVGVSMHLLVLSAFRPEDVAAAFGDALSQCTFWCSVLSDDWRHLFGVLGGESQCTFWCSVLSDSVGD